MRSSFQPKADGAVAEGLCQAVTARPAGPAGPAGGGLKHRLPLISLPGAPAALHGHTRIPAPAHS